MGVPHGPRKAARRPPRGYRATMGFPRLRGGPPRRRAALDVGHGVSPPPALTHGPRPAAPRSLVTHGGPSTAWGSLAHPPDRLAPGPRRPAAAAGAPLT